MVTCDSDHNGATSTSERPPVVGRPACAVGGRYAGCRRHEFLAEVELQRISREPTPGGTMDAPRCRDDRVRGDDRGSDGVDAAVDGEAGTDETRRACESDLLRAQLSRVELRHALATCRRSLR